MIIKVLLEELKRTKKNKKKPPDPTKKLLMPLQGDNVSMVFLVSGSDR